MKQEEKNRIFESETLILPALKMVLVENEKNNLNGTKKKVQKKAKKNVTEDTVMRIIGKLSLRD